LLCFPKASVDARTARLAEESRRADGGREWWSRLSHRGVLEEDGGNTKTLKDSYQAKGFLANNNDF